MRILTVALMLSFATMPLTQYMGKVVFTGVLWLIFFTFSGTFVLMPTVIEKAFGDEHYSANYGLLFTSQVRYTGTQLRNANVKYELVIYTSPSLRYLFFSFYDFDTDFYEILCT